MHISDDRTDDHHLNKNSAGREVKKIIADETKTSHKGLQNGEYK